MKFKEILRFEFSYQIRLPQTWLFFIALVAISYLNTGDDSVADALYEDLFLNSSFAVAKTTVVGTFIWLVMAAVIAGSAAARDISTRIYPLTHTTPITKADYIGGRFLAAFFLNALMLIGVQIGIAAGIYSPGVDPQIIGPFGAAPFLTAYAFISLPNAFFGTAIQFWLATRSGRPTTSYFGSFFLFFMGFFVAAALLFYSSIGTLVDPIGIRYIIEDLAHVWTPTERRSRLLALEGTILANRLIWLSVGFAVLVITYVRFRFTDRSRKAGWWKRRRRRKLNTETGDQSNSAPIVIPQVARTFNFGNYVLQTITIGWASFRSIWTGRTALALTIGIPLLTLIVTYNKIPAGGVPRIPTSALVLGELTAPLSDVLSPWSIIPFLLVIFAGEMVWRERDANMGDLTDTAPTSEWSLLLGKFFAVGIMTAAFMVLLVVGGMLTQTMMGYHNFDIALYARILFGLQFPEYFLFAVLVVIIHVLLNSKYVAHLVAIIVSAFIVMPGLFGIEHNLLVYNAGPQWTYSEMRGFGASLQPWYWFKLYWTTWALLLTILATLFWVRGKDNSLHIRLQLARNRFTSTTKMPASVTGLLVITLGSFIFYNTNILNVYLTADEYDEVLAEYEQRYKRFEKAAQPVNVATNLHIEIFPERGSAEIKGTYHLVNKSNEAIDSIHLAIIPGAKTDNVVFDRATTTTLTDDAHGHRIYSLQDPLQPGDSLQLQFNVLIERRGFGNHGVDESVVGNGTFFTNNDWLPAIGYQSTREIMSANDRREHGLPAKSLVPSLYDSAARMTHGEKASLEVTMVTDEDQVAVAPGALQKTWTNDGRRYFSYKTDGPIGSEYPFFSAKYSVHETRWTAPHDPSQTVDIRIFYHPTHTNNIERMTRSIQTSFDNYTKQFGPYLNSHLTMVEVRGNEIGMHADQSLIRFSEGTALWNPGSFDLPFSVVAHEVAHQWWGHKLQAAFVEGAPVLSESMAVFCSMNIMKKTFGLKALHEFMSFMRLPYPYAPIHRGEPLLRGIDPYLAYRKGPFALYALGDRIGAERVDDALQGLMLKHPAGQVPLTTTLDLYSELQSVTPDPSRQLLHDLFEVNTLWQFKIERVAAIQTKDSTWQVRLDLTSRKVVVDSAGVETEVPMNELVDIGIFAISQDRLSKPIYLDKHLITSKTQTITLTVSQKPYLAGIDPYHVLDWEEREDDENIRRVKIE